MKNVNLYIFFAASLSNKKKQSISHWKFMVEILIYMLVKKGLSFGLQENVHIVK